MTLLARTARLLGAVLLGAALLTATACGGKKKPSADQGNFPSGADESVSSLTDSANATTDGQVPDDAAISGTGSSSKADAARRAALEKGGELSQEGAAIEDLQPVYFKLDSSDIDDAAKAQIKKNAEFLAANEKYHVVLRGHCDDSGTEEYNMALGSRRAQGVYDELAAQGVDAARLETISFGENLPAVEGTDEASRSKNRRVEFFVYTIE